MTLLVLPDGSVRCVYAEDVDLRRLGSARIRRGSHVEPTADARWTADLAPVNGPRLGPFPTRTDALAAEQEWLETHWLTRSTMSD